MSNKLRIAPTFVSTQAWIEGIVAGIFGLLLIGVYFPMLVFLIQLSPQIDLLLWFLTFLSFALPMAGYVFIKQQNYAKTFFEFNEDRLLFYEGFFNIQKKEVLIKNFIEVNCTKNFLQRMFGVGTIILNTAATGQIQGFSGSGIKIKDIENPDQYYEKIRDIVHKKQLAA